MPAILRPTRWSDSGVVVVSDEMAQGVEDQTSAGDLPPKDPDADAPIALNPTQRALFASCLVVAAIVLCGRHEIGRIISDVAVGGKRYKASVLSSPLEVHHSSDAIHAWNAAADLDIHRWLGWFSVCETLLLVSLWGAAAVANTGWKLAMDHWLRWAIGAWAVHEFVVWIVVLSHATAFVPLAASTYVSWALTLAVGVKLIVTVRSDTNHRQALKRGLRALGVQRFQLGVVGLLGVLFVVPGPPVLEQGVDVVRSWVLGSPNWSSALWGLGSFIALAATLRYLGSVRAAPRYAGRQDDVLDQTRPTWWALCTELGASLLVVVGLALVYLLLRQTKWTRIDWRVAMMTAVVIVAVPVVGLIARLFNPPAINVATTLKPDDVAQARQSALVVARLLAVAVPIILLVSVCRSLFAPMMLVSSVKWRCATVIALCSVGALATMIGALRIGPPSVRISPAGTSLFNAFDPQMVGARRPDASSPKAVPVTGDGDELYLDQVPNWFVSIAPSLVLTIGVASLVLWLPMRASRLLGLVGTVGLCLLMLTAFFMTMSIISQIANPPYVFRLAGQRRTPTFELVLVVALLSTLFAKGTSLHAIRDSDSPPTSKRPTLDEVSASWIAARQADGWSCALDVSLPTQSTATGKPTTMTLPQLKKVQPLVLVAAEGGGIRAAWWTVDAMSVLTSTECGTRSLFLASGVSGGAVGLGLMASVGPTETDPSTTPLRALNTMAHQDGLAAGVSGLLGRDLIAGAFGIEANPADVPDSVDNFPDRAGLIEYAWERTIPGLDAPFPSAKTSDLTVPWKTVFNGTSVGYSCRALISDVQLISDEAVNDCDAPGNEMAGSYDVFLKHPCYLGIATSTASLLAARFPYVTPSGVLQSKCSNGGFSDQVIDGGYAENTGIDTANSVLSQLMPAIRATNAKALAPGGNGTVIVPIVVFMHNTVAASSQTAPTLAKPSPESAIPVLNSGAAGTLGDTATLLQHSGVIASEWVPDGYATMPSGANPTESMEDQMVAAVRAVLPSQVVTIAPQQAPQMALPLGWSMSSATEDTLDAALDSYLRCPSKHANQGTHEIEVACSASFALDQLLQSWHTTMTFPQSR